LGGLNGLSGLEGCVNFEKLGEAEVFAGEEEKSRFSGRLEGIYSVAETHDIN